MKKKLDTGKVLNVLIVLGIVALGGVYSEKYWLVLPFLFFLSGVVVGNLNNEDV